MTVHNMALSVATLSIVCMPACTKRVDTCNIWQQLHSIYENETSSIDSQKTLMAFVRTSNVTIDELTNAMQFEKLQNEFVFKDDHVTGFYMELLEIAINTAEERDQCESLSRTLATAVPIDLDQTPVEWAILNLRPKSPRVGLETILRTLDACPAHTREYANWSIRIRRLFAVAADIERTAEPLSSSEVSKCWQSLHSMSSVASPNAEYANYWRVHSDDLHTSTETWPTSVVP